MKLEKNKIYVSGIKFSIKENNKEIARAYLYILKNNLHKNPFGFIEDVFIDEEFRGNGLGTKLIKEIIKTAKQKNCYKLIANSRHQRKPVHKFYRDLGFISYGLEFRLDL